MRFIQPNMKHQKSFHALGEGVPKGPGKLAGWGGAGDHTWSTANIDDGWDHGW